MENNFQNIDDQFKEASDASEEKLNNPEFEKIWNKVEEKLDQKESKKRILPIWFSYGIAASLAIGLGIYFYNSKNSVEILKPQIAISNDLPIQSPKIQDIDKTIKSNIEKEKNTTSNENVVNEKVVVKPSKINNNVVFERSERYTADQYYVENKDITNADVLKPQPSQEKTKEIESVVVTAMGIKREQKSLDYNTRKFPSTVYISSNSSNFSQTLEGRVAGLQISPSIGNSGSSPVVRVRGISTLKKAKNIELKNNLALNQSVVIRGISSVQNGKEPLIVLDGEVYNYNVMQSLNAERIESVSVLKDAAATSLYGSKAQNGVIIIESKSLNRKERKELRKISDEFDKKESIKISGNSENTTEEYDAYIENPFESAKNEPLSTFSIDVDKAAYSNVRRMINNGQKVDKNAVRIEEMINYFNYSYPQPKDQKPFSVNSEYGDAAWNPKHKLLKIGLQGKIIPFENLPNSNIVFLIDVSGSMNEANKLPLLKSSFKVLLNKLKPEDKVGIVVYAGNAGMVLEPTSVKNKEKIIEALENLQAGGSTAGGAGIELAYKLSQENFIKNGNNRVIIATDGDFNVGTSSVADLGTLIEEKRKTGIFLTCLGFGMGNYKDNRLETLADKGNGNYAYIDTMQEADKFLGKEFAGSIYAIAKDVKIQVEFNPKFVKSYRLIGYENRKLQNEDFTDDKKDAGELGSGHTVTALYEIIPVGVNSDFEVNEIPLKYSDTKENSQNFGDELATIKLRYKKPDEDKSIEIQQIVKNKPENFSPTSADFKFATSVSWFGLVLRDSKYLTNQNLSEIIALAKQGIGKDEDGFRSEFIRLVESYKTLK